MDTVTVTATGRRYTLTFSRLPGRKFGPWPFADTVRDLRVSALLSAVAARDLVMDASVHGSVTAEVDHG